MWRAGGRVRRDRGRATCAPRHRKAREGDGCGGSAEVSLIEKCGERHGGARRGVGGWARVTAVGVASSEEKGGQARPPLFGFVFSSSNSGRV